MNTGNCDGDKAPEKWKMKKLLIFAIKNPWPLTSWSGGAYSKNTGNWVGDKAPKSEE